jgi:tellurite methyltransferase
MTDADTLAYYATTVGERPWPTVLWALARFETEDRRSPRERLAVDLGCGAGRDTRELLRRGWRVLAIDRESSGIAALRKATPRRDHERLETRVADLATARYPRCDLVVASLSLTFVVGEDWCRAWTRIRGALRPGARFAGMFLCDRDEAAGDPLMTCPPPRSIRRELKGLRVERWSDQEYEGFTAAGEPHHVHLVEVVARRPEATRRRDRR